MAGKQTLQWPAWYYGPGGQSGIFERYEDVPPGWRSNPQDVVEIEPPPPPDGPDAWAGYTKERLSEALRRAGQPIRAFETARIMFERAVYCGAIPGYGSAHEN